MSDHLEHFRAWVEANSVNGPSTVLTPADESAMRATLTEVEQLRAQRTFLDGQVFISGWYAHAEACVSLGLDAREAAWRKYREEMTETLAKAAPQQPENDGEAP